MLRPCHIEMHPTQVAYRDFFFVTIVTINDSPIQIATKQIKSTPSGLRNKPNIQAEFGRSQKMSP